MNIRRIAWVALAVLPLWGCGTSDQDDLRQWMDKERAETKPRVTPLTEPKPYKPVSYTMDAAMDPFDSMRLTQALRRESTQMASNAALIAPELARRKEPLEAFPLDAIAMVGSLNKEGKPTALLKVDKLIYQAHVGNHLGQNYGRITAINETSIQLREIVQDPTGDWIERTTSLELQEEAKK